MTGLPLFVLLMVLTALTVFTDLLDEQLVPGVNLAILLAYVVFFAPVVAAHVYVSRMRALDELAQQAMDEATSPAGGRA